MYFNTVFRAPEPPLCSCRSRPNSVREGQGSHRCLPSHQPPWHQYADSARQYMASNADCRLLVSVMGQEPRQTTSNIGHLHKPSIQALIHGLNRHYYSIAINFRKTELEQIMLLNLHKQNWTDGLMLKDFEEHSKQNEESVKVSCMSWFGTTEIWRAVSDNLAWFFSQKMLTLAAAYNKSVQEESTLSNQELKTRHVGKQDPKRHLEDAVENAMGDQVCCPDMYTTAVLHHERSWYTVLLEILDRAKSGSHAALTHEVDRPIRKYSIDSVSLESVDQQMSR